MKPLVPDCLISVLSSVQSCNVQSQLLTAIVSNCRIKNVQVISKSNIHCPQTHSDFARSHVITRILISRYDQKCNPITFWSFLDIFLIGSGLQNSRQLFCAQFEASTGSSDTVSQDFPDSSLKISVQTPIICAGRSTSTPSFARLQTVNDAQRPMTPIALIVAVTAVRDIFQS